MFTPLHHSRLKYSAHACLSWQEARLCRMTPPGPPESRNFPIIDSFNSFVTNMWNRITGFVNPGERNEKQVRENIATPRRWLDAFARREVFIEPQRARDSLSGQVFGPQELLQTMTREERVEAFYEFIRNILPPATIETITGTPLPAEPTEAVKERVLKVAGIVLGARAPERAEDIADARLAFTKLYPAGELGHIYEDYMVMVREIRRTPGTGIPPANEDFNDPVRLLRLIEQRANQLRPGRHMQFLGWLRVEDPKVARERLVLLGQARRLSELSGDQITLKNEQMVSKLQKGVREDLERRNRSFTDNFAMLEPWQQYAVIGLGLFAAYKLWNKPGRFLGIIPYWTIPTGLVGWYLYRRLMVGDQDAFNTITRDMQRGGNKIIDTGRNLFNRTAGPPTVAQEDASRLSIMSRYLDQRAFLRQFPAAGPMMTVAEVKMSSFAGSAFRVGMDSKSHIQYSLYGGPESPIYQEVQGIIKRRRYDGNYLHQVFHEHSDQIAQGVGSVFYQLAARNPENRNRVRRIEEARRSAGRVATIAGASSLSYDNIADPALKQEYVNMIEEGRGIALANYPNKSLIELIEMFMAESPENAERPDNAERVTAPGTPPNITRTAEIALYQNARTLPLTPEREASKKVILAEFQEFLASASGRPPSRLPLLNAGAATELERFAIALLDDTDKSLSEVLRILEQVKYAVYIGAAARGGGSPLGTEDIVRIIGAAGSPDRLNLAAIASNIGQYINNTLRIFSNFQNIQSLENVKRLLEQRFFSGVASGPAGLAELRKQITSHQERFTRMKNPERAAQIFINALPATTVARFGATPKEARDRLTTFVQRMIASPQYQRYIEQGEQYYAQRVTNDIVIAQLSTHRRDGNHALDSNPSDRFISPTEEQNLLVSNEFLLNNILGPDETRPLNGMWAAMTMRQLLNDFRPDDAARLDATSEPSRLRAVENTRQVAYLYLSLQEITPDEAVDLELRNRVRTVAQKFVDEYTRVSTSDPAAGRPAAIKALLEQPSFRGGMPNADGIRDIVGTMLLLGITAGPDAALVKSLEDIIAGLPPPTPTTPVTTPPTPAGPSAPSGPTPAPPTGPDIPTPPGLPPIPAPPGLPPVPPAPGMPPSVPIPPAPGIPPPAAPAAPGLPPIPAAPGLSPPLSAPGLPPIPTAPGLPPTLSAPGITPPVPVLVPPAPGLPQITVPPAPPGLPPGTQTLVIPPPPGLPPATPGIVIPPAPGLPAGTPTLLVPPAPGLPSSTPWIVIPPAPGIAPIPTSPGVPLPPGVPPGIPMIVMPQPPGLPATMPGIVIPAAPGLPANTPAIVIPPAPGLPATTPWIVMPSAPGLPAQMVPPPPGFVPPVPAPVPPSAPGLPSSVPSLVPPAPGLPLTVPPLGILSPGTPMRMVPPPPGLPATMPGIVIPPAPGLPAGTPAIVVPPAPGLPSSTPWIVVPPAPGLPPVASASGVPPPPGIVAGTPMIVVPAAPGIPPATPGIVIPPAPGSPAGTPAIVIPPAPGVPPITPWLVIPRAPDLPAMYVPPAPGFTPPLPTPAVPRAPGLPPTTL